MSNQKRTSNLRMNDAVGITVLLILLVIVPTGIGYMSTSIFRFPVWLGIITGLASSIVILLSLVFLLGATVRFPDHVPWPENDSEVESNGLRTAFSDIDV